jgi:hypothetical protein
MQCFGCGSQAVTERSERTAQGYRRFRWRACKIVGCDQVGGEHAARQPVLAQKMPDVLNRVQFGRSGGQQHQREVVWHDEVLGAVPSGPVHQHDPMGSGSHGLRDFRQVQAHGLRVASGQHQGRALTLLRADRPEDVDRACPLIVRGARPGGCSPGCDMPAEAVSEFSCVGRAVDPVQAMARVKRSPKRMANCALAIHHSRAGMVHSFSDRFKTKNSSFRAASSVGK